jgi:hypothetical protein
VLAGGPDVRFRGASASGHQSCEKLMFLSSHTKKARTAAVEPYAKPVLFATASGLRRNLNMQANMSLGFKSLARNV